MPATATLATLLSRRSVSPRRLTHPGPTRAELDSIFDVGLRAPDHCGLLPWRVIEFDERCRGALADLFEAEKLRRDPLASQEDRDRAREHATRSPVVLAFVVRPVRHPLVPVYEQWLSAGAALGNMLMAAQASGYGAIILSGERCHDGLLRAALGLTEGETLAGFISIGTVSKAPSPAAPKSRDSVRSVWSQPVATVDRAVSAKPLV